MLSIALCTRLKSRSYIEAKRLLLLAAVSCARVLSSLVRIQPEAGDFHRYGCAPGDEKCPDLIVIRPDFHLYRQYSRAFMQIAYSYTPLLEATSIDECYLDITGSKQFGTPVEIAEQIQLRIGEELGLPCSIGIAPNKLLAKMASDLKKPNGISILRMRTCRAFYGTDHVTRCSALGKRRLKSLKAGH